MSLFGFSGDGVNKKLHWTTLYTEKALLAVIGCLTVVAACQSIWAMWLERNVDIADLFMLFIYTEIVGMVGAFFISNRIPVTLPIIIAMTALCRLIVLHGKDGCLLSLVAEASAILILAISAYVISQKDKLSLQKLKDFTKNDNDRN